MAQPTMLLTIHPRINWSPDALLDAGVSLSAVNAAAAEQIIAETHASIDALADLVYTQSASRSARYVQKAAEARAYLAAVAPAPEDYPMLAAESVSRGLTLTQMAESVIAASDAFTLLAAGVEAARATVAIAIEEADSIAEMRAIAAAAIGNVETALNPPAED